MAKKQQAKAAAQSAEKSARWVRVYSWLHGPGVTLYVLGVSFATSFGNIVHLCNKHGIHGWHAYTLAGIFDAVPAMAQGYRRLDKRPRTALKGFERLVTVPTLVLLAGISLTIAANMASSSPGAWGHFLFVLPPSVFMLGILLMEWYDRMLATVLELSQNQGDPVSEPVQNRGQNRADGNPQNHSDGPENQNHGDGGGQNPGTPEPPPGDTPWLPAKINRHAPQSVDALNVKIRQAMTDYEARNGKPISAYWLGKVLECSKADAIVLRREATAGAERGKAAV